MILGNRLFYYVRGATRAIDGSLANLKQIERSLAHGGAMTEFANAKLLNAVTTTLHGDPRNTIGLVEVLDRQLASLPDQATLGVAAIEAHAAEAALAHPVGIEGIQAAIAHLTTAKGAADNLLAPLAGKHAIHVYPEVALIYGVGGIVVGSILWDGFTRR